jgi:hypothetical protein
VGFSGIFGINFVLEMHEPDSCTRGPREQCRSMVHGGLNLHTPSGDLITAISFRSNGTGSMAIARGGWWWRSQAHTEVGLTGAGQNGTLVAGSLTWRA